VMYRVHLFCEDATRITTQSIANKGKTESNAKRLREEES